MTAIPERILCLVTDVERAGGQAKLAGIVEQAVRGGVNMVQVRAHDLEDDALASLARDVIAAARASDGKAMVIVNGSVDAARSSGADGIHLPERGEFPESARRDGLLVGRSVHSLQKARDAAASGIDYLVLGTIFPSQSHPGVKTGGTGLVRCVAGRIQVPVVGIGGITAGNAPSVIAAGASGVAVIGAIIDSNNPFEAARALSQAILDQE